MAIEKGQGRIVERERDPGVGLAAEKAAGGLAGLWGLVRSPVVLGLVVFVLALLPRVLDLDVFVGPDEFTWDTRSANFARAIMSGNLAETYQDGYPGVTLMWIETVGAWLRYGVESLAGQADWESIVGPDKSMSLLSSKRQVLATANALLVALIALLSWRLFGAGVAWLAGLLLAFDPFLLTESRFLRSEAIMTAFVSLALLSLLLYLRREQGVGYSALAGVLAGLAVLSKVSAVALLPVGALVIGVAPLLDQTQPPAGRWRAAIVRLAAWGGAFVLTVFLLWPALWVEPLDVAWKMYQYVGVRVAEGNEGGASFFLGQPRPDDEVGPLFYPVALLYRSTPVLWLGLLLLAAAGWARRLTRQDKLALAVMLLFLAVYLAVITSSILKFDRFIIPMLPTLTVMAALGFVAAWRWWAGGRITWAAVLLLAPAVQVALALPHHPYYLTYWNPLLGGLKQAVRVLPVADGEGLDQVAAYLNDLPGAEEIKLASGNSQKIRPLLKGETIALANLDGKWVQGDYVLIYLSQLQRDKHDINILEYLRRQPPVQTVSLHGLEYAWLYPGPAAHYYGGGQTLEGRGTLYGYDLDTTEVAAGEALAMTLYWRNEGQQAGDRFFVRLVDLAGYVWAEGLAQPRPGFEEAGRQGESILESDVLLSLPVGMPPGDYFLKPGFRTVEGEIIGYFELPGDAPAIKVAGAVAYPAPGDWQPPVPVRLPANDDLVLAGYDVSQHGLLPGADGWVTLYWQALADVRRDYVILIRLVDRQEQELAYWLGRPVQSGYPTTAWRAGQIVQDPWLITIPDSAQPGVYQLEVALFDAETEAEVNRQVIGEMTVR